MAVPLRSTAVPAARPNRQLARTARPGARPSRPGTTSGAASRVGTRDHHHLRVVPVRRRTAGLVFLAAIVLAGLMLGAAVLNTRLAERQLRVDELDQDVAESRTRFDVLRGQRAELRSPGRLSREATALGMFTATAGTFVRVSPDVYARALAASGSIDEAERIVRGEQPLDQFRRVKIAGG